MIDLGTVKPGSTIRIPFSTYDKDDGSSITQTNYAAADILIYKDGSTTERASTSGFTATTDFDSKTGKHVAVIDLADNTTAGFFSAGSEYMVAIDSVTVDTVTTGGWIARFRIGYPNAVLDTTIATLSTQTSFTLTNGPAEDDALNGFTMMAHDVASAVQAGMAYVLDYTGSTKTVTLVAGPTFTMATTDNVSFFPPIQIFGFGGTAGTFSGGRPEVNMTHIAGASVSTSTAQLGVNVVNFGGSAGTFASGRPEVNTSHFGGTAGTFASGRPEVNATHFAGTAYATALAAEVDAVWDEVLTAAAHNVANSAGRRLRTLQTGGNYEGGLVWLDTADGTAGTTLDENGVVTNPVDSMADAQTIATAGNLKGIHVAHGNTITLAAAMENLTLIGDGYTLALGGQSISGSKITGASTLVSGTATGTFPFFYECGVGAVTLPPCAMDRCGLQSTMTVGSAGDYYLVDCFSQVAGTSAPVIDMGAAVGATNVSIRRWSGGLTLNNVQTGDVISIDVVSGGTITVNGTGGTVHIRGIVNVSDGSGGSVTIVQTQVINRGNIQTEAEEALQTYHLDHLIASADPGSVVADSSFLAKLTSKSATPSFASYNNQTDSLEAIRDNMGTAQTGDTYALANGANGFVAIKADTAAILDDTGTSGVVVDSASKTGYRLSATGVDDIHDEVVEGTTTLRQSVRLANSANASKASGMGTTTAVIRDIGDTKDRITATVDANGNRTAITLDVT